MNGIKWEPPTIRITPKNANEAIEGMSFSCPYCFDEVPRYDLRMHHFIWECTAYPQEKKRVFLMEHFAESCVHS